MSKKYDGWNQYFRNLEGDEVTLTFDQLEELIDGSLPNSAYEYQPWWSNAQYHAIWSRHGWSASPNLRIKTVRFRKKGTRKRDAAGTTPEIPLPSKFIGQHEKLSGDRVVLLGCVSEKKETTAPAKNLYISPLWEKRKKYAESTGQLWAILSAEYGLVMPETELQPYDRSLKDETSFYRKDWSKRVLRDVLDLCTRMDIATVEMHAGAAYIESGLIDGLQDAGISVHRPLQGMRIGEQLSWYTNLDVSNADDKSYGESQDDLESIRTLRSVPTIVSAKLIGPFEYKWPVNVEKFEKGWEGEIDIDGKRVSFRHGLGGRNVYESYRVHTVTWLERAPAVEGVAADDYSESRALISRLKRVGGKMARSREEVSTEYSAFLIVDHRSEINAKNSPRGLGVKIREDDIAAWVHHAVLRMRTKSQKLTSPKKHRSESRPRSVHSDPHQSKEALSNLRKQEVAQSIVDFAPDAAQIAGDLDGESFANDPEANQLLANDPLAFLFAVIADYQIPAERAWALPYLLKGRLGHLDPNRMLAEPDAVAVAVAVASKPALHRYVNKVSDFILEACRIVLNQYAGNASQIWDGGITAVEVQQRLKEFPGISQKKAAMAVEILERDFGVPIREMSGSDVAYDVHIRRVFLRSGLAEIDDVDHMVETAREIWPERPGTLDLPSWVIGRTWCRPMNPDCGACPIGKECARLISAAEVVRGA